MSFLDTLPVSRAPRASGPSHLVFSRPRALLSTAWLTATPVLPSISVECASRESFPDHLCILVPFSPYLLIFTPLAIHHLMSIYLLDFSVFLPTEGLSESFLAPYQNLTPASLLFCFPSQIPCHSSVTAAFEPEGSYYSHTTLWRGPTFVSQRIKPVFPLTLSFLFIKVKDFNIQ